MLTKTRQFWLTTGLAAVLTSAVLPLTAFVYQYTSARIEQSAQKSLTKRLIFHRMMIVQLSLGQNTIKGDKEALDAIRGKDGYHPIIAGSDSVSIAGLVLNLTPPRELKKDDMNLVMITPLLGLERALQSLQDGSERKRIERALLNDYFSSAMKDYYEEVSKY